MKFSQDALWAGTEHALQAHFANEELVAAKLSAGPGDMGQDDDDGDSPYLVSQVRDGVAIINIKGSLTNRDSWVNKYFGITSYPAIREALVWAAQSADVSQILLDVDSGGGAVNGVADTANLIRVINDRIKPVTAFAGGTMASAAYWLGCSAGKVYAENTAMVGSIGVLTTHVEYSKQMAAEGATATVVRSGKYKALANSVEPLSAEGKAQLESLVNATDAIFVQHVATMRNSTYPDVQNRMGEGREFIGAAAQNVGLIDGVSTFDSVLSSLCQDQLDTQTSYANNGGSTQPGVVMKRALTEAEIAAMAEGAALNAAASAEVVAEQVQKAEPESQDAAEAVVQAAPVQADVLGFLQAQIRDKDAALLTANVEIAALKKAAEDFQSLQGGMMEITKASVGNLRIALGLPPVDLSAATPASVLAMHADLKTQFSAKFKAGGVAVVLDESKQGGEQREMSALERARLNAARPRIRPN